MANGRNGTNGNIANFNRMSLGKSSKTDFILLHLQQSALLKITVCEVINCSSAELF